MEQEVSYEMNNDKNMERSGNGGFIHYGLENDESSNTKCLEDDKRTIEVVRDLGLNRPHYALQGDNSGPIINNPISSGSATDMESMNIPPDFETNLVGEETRAFVSCIAEDRGNREMELEADGSNCSDSDSEEAKEAWNMGRLLGVFTNADSAAIQAIIEDLIDRKKGKRKKGKPLHSEKDQEASQKQGAMSSPQ